MRTLLTNRKLTLIFCLGLLLRVLFLVWGARLYYGTGQDAIFYNGDSDSYMLSFRNWWHLGQYTFDFRQPDAAFGRLPGYPFFYGLHYLLVGPAQASLAVACTQVLLDSCAVLLVFSSVRRLVGPAAGRGGWVPYAGALLYAAYPFAIVWVTVIGTETLATFLTLAWLAWLLRPARSTGHFVGLGLLLAAAFYVREYLGVLVPITCGYLLVAGPRGLAQTGRGQVAALLLVGGTFGALYVLWPIRNYAVSQRIILLKPVTAGYANYGVDMTSYRDWVLCWTADDQLWLDKIVTSGSVAFPPEVFASPQEAQQARQAAQLAHDCGSSFYLYRKLLPAAGAIEADARRPPPCNVEINALFTQLRASYVARHPVRYWLDVPTQNLAKAFFKAAKNPAISQAAAVGAKELLTRALFAWRSLLVVLGFAGLVRYYRQRQVWPVALFAGFMYFFICVLARKVEMRYLLQADALLLVPATLLLGALGNWLRPQPAGKAPAAG